jgi:hypothetical protein
VCPIGGERGRWLGFAAGSVGAMSWLVGMALQAKDTTAAAVTSVATVLALVACYMFVPHASPTRLRRFAVAHVLALGVFTLAMVNWRMQNWLAAMGGISLEHARRVIPLWTINLFTCVICGAMLLTVYISLPAKRDETSAGEPRRNSSGG